MASARFQWFRLARTFWFLPTVVAVAFVTLAFGLVGLDRRADLAIPVVGFGGDADAARQMLAVVAASLITVAGVTFSITVVTLQLVSTQYTPRALRSLLRDRTNQGTAGALVGIFLYCIVVLAEIRGGSDESGRFVPSLSVTLGIGLSALGLALLLAFINHMGESIKVSSIAARIAQDTLAAIDALYPDAYGAQADERDSSPRGDEEPLVIAADRAGYLQAIDTRGLVRRLPRGAILELDIRPGTFTADGRPLARLRSPGHGPGVERLVRRALRVTDDRDTAQDAGYGVRQLADIALRAISPGVNDPTTAINCIRYLEAALERLAGREIPAERTFVDRATVVVPGTRFDEYLEEAFLEIGRYATRDARVVAAVLDALVRVRDAAAGRGAQERVEEVERVATAVAQPALEDARTDYDRATIGGRLAHFGARD